MMDKETLDSFKKEFEHIKTLEEANAYFDERKENGKLTVKSIGMMPAFETSDTVYIDTDRFGNMINQSLLLSEYHLTRLQFHSLCSL